MIPCKSRFLCIWFPRLLVGITSLLQYKIFTRMQLLNNNNNNNNNNNKKMVWQFNEALTLSHVWSVTFCSSFMYLVYVTCSTYICTNSYNHHNLKSGYSFKISFVEVNCSLTPAIPFECHQPKLINRLSRSSLRMLLAKANH
jgi:hypothetical protein